MAQRYNKEEEEKIFLEREEKVEEEEEEEEEGEEGDFLEWSGGTGVDHRAAGAFSPAPAHPF